MKLNTSTLHKTQEDIVNAKKERGEKLLTEDIVTPFFQVNREISADELAKAFTLVCKSRSKVRGLTFSLGEPSDLKKAGNVSVNQIQKLASAPIQDTCRVLANVVANTPNFAKFEFELQQTETTIVPKLQVWTSAAQDFVGEPKTTVQYLSNQF